MNDIEKSLFILGRVLVGVFFVVMGLNHFGNLEGMTAMVETIGIPAPATAVVLTGLLLVLAGLSFLFGFHPPLGVLAAALFLVPVTLVVHSFWTFENPAQRADELSLFLRNVGLLGASLLFLAIDRPWPMSLDEMIARRRRKKSEKKSEKKEPSPVLGGDGQEIPV